MVAETDHLGPATLLAEFRSLCLNKEESLRTLERGSRPASSGAAAGEGSWGGTPDRIHHELLQFNPGLLCFSNRREKK